MARALNDRFFKWLQENPTILEIISQYHCLDIRFSEGKALNVYFKGHKVLTIKDKIITDESKAFIIPNNSHFREHSKLINEICGNKGVCIENLNEYLDCILSFLSKCYGYSELMVRQEITYINNRSGISNNTDYFIVEEEYSIPEGRFDLVALKWPSIDNTRKTFSSSALEIVVFELKKGIGAIGSSPEAVSDRASLKTHIDDFYKFYNNDEALKVFKKDIIKMFVQQSMLKGFFNDIKGLKNVRKYAEPWDENAINDIADKVPIKFGFILSDFNQKSSLLKEQIKQIDANKDFLFATSSFMGYGLYEESMLNRTQLEKILEISEKSN